MGRIKTKLIKRKTLEVLSLHGDSFTSEFNKNKEMTDRFVKTESKKIRNIIAGYATRLKRKEA
ncbi:MAG: 30S ribosomal protein S17e [archaeon]|nr:30S ribosomal protein S17e [archaeon]